jgi:uncharacterized protein DUF1932
MNGGEVRDGRSAAPRPSQRRLADIEYARTDAFGILESLIGEASLTTRSALTEVLEDGMLPSVAARAWRWRPELVQCAEAPCDDGLPGESAYAAAQILDRRGSARDIFDGDVRGALNLLGGPR